MTEYNLLYLLIAVLVVWLCSLASILGVTTVATVQPLALTRKPVEYRCAIATLPQHARVLLVVPHVLCLSHHAKVLYSVIRAYLIDVMNMLMASERSSEMLLHNQSVFKDVPIPIPHQNVPIVVECGLTAVVVRTSPRTKPTSSLAGKPSEFDFAPFALHQLSRGDSAASSVRRVVARTTTELIGLGRAHAKGGFAVLADTVRGKISAHSGLLSWVSCRRLYQQRVGDFVASIIPNINRAVDVKGLTLDAKYQ
ncbi:MAG: hypothetical protein M3440_05090 [Chloroflexota bacterium]|nr:hypothetical protein [Chloroflexota bacterium]